MQHQKKQKTKNQKQNWMVSPTCRYIFMLKKKRVHPYQGDICDANGVSTMSRSSFQHTEPGVYVVRGIRPPGGDQYVIIFVLNSYNVACFFFLFFF